VELLREDKTLQFKDGEPRVTYLVRREHQGNRTAQLAWTADLQTALQDMHGEAPAEKSVATVAAALRTFLDALHWDSHEEAQIAEARKNGQRSHVVIRVKVHELLALPWELVPILDGKTPIGRTDDCLVQYEIPGTRTAHEPPGEEGGRVLFAWAGDVNADAHRAKIEEACRESGLPFDPRTDVLPHATPNRLRDAIQKNRPAVLHLLCHGAWMASESAYGLSLYPDHEGDDKDAAAGDAGEKTVPVAPSRLWPLLRSSSIRLVVLCACWGGAPGDLSGLLGSAAEELHESGIQAIIACRYPLSKPGSVTLTEVLYRELLSGMRSLQDAFLAARQALTLDDRSYDWAGIQLFARSEDGHDLRPFRFRPYRGLLAFDGASSRYFFGRDREIAQALAQIEALLPVPGAAPDLPRFFAVTGASGLGKTSFLEGGLLPALRRYLHERQREVVTRTVSGADGMQAVVEALAEPREGKLLVLVLDRLEERFTSRTERDIGPATDFAKRLWSIAADPGQSVLVLVAMRDDLLDRCRDVRLAPDLTLFQALTDKRHHLALGPLGDDALEQIIVRPARLVGLGLQDGLVERIIDDAREDRGTLPLVQQLLDEMWRAHSGPVLELRDYDRRGGLTGAFKALAERTWESLAQAGKGTTAQRLLVKLVTVDEDAERGIRRVARKSDLRGEVGGDPEVFDQVLEDLVRARLVVVRAADGAAPSPGDESARVEIAHEALIRRWPRLRDWAVADAAVQKQLAVVRALEAEKERERRAAEEDRERQERHNRRVLLTAVTAGVLAVLAIGFGVWAGLETKVAKSAQADARSNEQKWRRESTLSAARTFLARNEAVIASKLLLEIDRPEETKGWIDVANEILEKKLPARTFRGWMSEMSPDGQWIASADSSLPAVLVSLSDGSGQPREISHRKGDFSGLNWSPDGALVAVSQGGTVTLYRPHDGGPPRELPGTGGRAGEPFFSASGRFVAALMGDHATVWSVDHDEQSADIVAAGLQSIRLGADGRHALVTRQTAAGLRLEVWTQSPEVPCEAASQKKRPCRVATLEEDAMGAGFSPDGWQVYAARKASPDDVEQGLLVDTWPVGQWASPARTVVVSTPKQAKLELVKQARWLDGDLWVVQEQDMSLQEGVSLRRGDGRTERRILGSAPVRASRDGRALAVTRDDVVSVTTKARFSRRVELWTSAASVDDLSLSPTGDLALASSGRTNRSLLFRLSDGASGVVYPNDVQGELVQSWRSWIGADARHAVLTWAWPAGLGGDADEDEDGLMERTLLWDLTTDAPATDLRGVDPHISIDGRRAVVKNGEGLLVYDMHAPEKPRRVPSPSDPERCPVSIAAFDEEARQVFFVCEDGSLRAADAAVEGPSRLVAAPSNCVPDRAPILSAQGTTAIVFCSPADVRLIGPGREASLLPLCDPPGDTSDWDLTADGRTVICSMEEKLVVFSLDAPEAPLILPGWGSPLMNLSTSLTGRRFWVLSADNTVRVFSADAPDDPFLTAPCPQKIGMVNLDPTGESLVTTSTDGWVRVYPPGSSGGEPIMLSPDGSNDGAIPLAALDRGARHVLVARDGGTARLYDLSIRSLRAGLEKNADCLSPEIRMNHLGEDLKEATARYTDCEIKHGRAPSAAPAKTD
jgi:WD40 repeat protein